MECFAPLKTFDLHRVKIMCNSYFKILNNEKLCSLTISENCCVKILEVIEKQIRDSSSCVGYPKRGAIIVDGLCVGGKK